MLNTIKKAWKYVYEKSPNPTLSEWEKICPDCRGSGYEDIFSECEICEGAGVVRMTFKEKYSLQD